MYFKKLHFIELLLHLKWKWEKNNIEDHCISLTYIPVISEGESWSITQEPEQVIPLCLCCAGRGFWSGNTNNSKNTWAVYWWWSSSSSWRAGEHHTWGSGAWCVEHCTHLHHPHQSGEGWRCLAFVLIMARERDWRQSFAGQELIREKAYDYTISKIRV